MNKTIRAILPFLISGFIFSIILSSTAYFNSTFIETTFLNTTPGVWYTMASVIVLIVSFRLPYLQSKIGNSKLTLIVLSVLSLSLLGLSYPPSQFTLMFFVIFLASGTIVLSTLDIFIEKYSSDEFTGRVRGIYLSSLALAWIFSPFIGSTLIGNAENFSLLYQVAFFMSLIVITSVYFSSKHFIDNEYVHHDFKDFFITLKDKTIRASLTLQFALQFFYAWMVIYTPIYLHDTLGLPWETIGKMFFIMLIPFVLIEYPLGKLADRKNDEKELLVFGFIITAIATAILGLAGNQDFVILAGILFFTRVGAATIEIMNESFFFKHVGPDEPTKVAMFRMTYPMAYIIAPVLAIPIIKSTNFNVLFIVLAFFLISMLWVVRRLKLRDVISSENSQV